MKKTKIILAAITGLLSLSVIFAFKAARFFPVPTVYYFTSAGHCISIPYVTDASSTGRTFKIPSAGYYTIKLSSTLCSNPLMTSVIVKYITEE